MATRLLDPQDTTPTSQTDAEDADALSDDSQKTLALGEVAAEAVKTVAREKANKNAKRKPRQECLDPAAKKRRKLERKAVPKDTCVKDEGMLIALTQEANAQISLQRENAMDIDEDQPDLEALLQK